MYCDYHVITANLCQYLVSKILFSKKSCAHLPHFIVSRLSRNKEHLRVRTMLYVCIYFNLFPAPHMFRPCPLSPVCLAVKLPYIFDVWEEQKKKGKERGKEDEREKNVSKRDRLPNFRRRWGGGQRNIFVPSYLRKKREREKAIAVWQTL